MPSGATVLNQSDTAGQVRLPFAAGTNLISKYILIKVVEGLNPCRFTDMAGGGTPENVTINNIAFTRQSGEEAAAGSRFNWTAYTTTINSACISLTFILHSLNRDNYATPPPPFDMAKETEVIGMTMSTYSKIS